MYHKFFYTRFTFQLINIIHINIIKFNINRSFCNQNENHQVYHQQWFSKIYNYAIEIMLSLISDYFIIDFNRDNLQYNQFNFIIIINVMIIVEIS